MGEWIDKRDANGRPYKERVIGYIDVADGSTYHDASFETASYWRDVALNPGRYEVTEHTWNGTPMVRTTIPGTVIAEHFPSSFAGVPFAVNPPHENAGKPTSVQPSTYSFMVHKQVGELFGHPFTLTEMSLEVKHQRSVAKRALSSVVKAQIPGAVEDVVRMGETIEELKFVNRIGTTVAFVNQDRTKFYLFDEKEGSDLVWSIESEVKSVSVNHRPDGSYEFKILQSIEANRSLMGRDSTILPRDDRSMPSTNQTPPGRTPSR